VSLRSVRYLLEGDPFPKVPHGLPRPEEAVCAVLLLGPIRVFRQGVPIEGGWRMKSLELLAYLAVHPLGASREQVLEALWPERDPAVTQKYLWRAVSDLRSRLGGGSRSSKTRFVERADDFYRLDPDNVWVDARVFQVVAAMEEAGNAKALLQFACALYKGEFCEGRFYPWAVPASERLARVFISAARRLGEVLLDCGAIEAALDLLDQAIERDPYDEELSRLAMRLEAGLGRRHRAIRRFVRLRRVLISDLGVEPTAETIEHFERSTETRYSSIELPAVRECSEPQGVAMIDPATQ
jgi:DNA-binding SARP family transcriptional activator